MAEFQLDGASTSAAPAAAAPSSSLVSEVRAEVEREQTIVDLRALVQAREHELGEVKAAKAVVEAERATNMSTISQLQAQLSSLQSAHLHSTTNLSVVESRAKAVENEKQELLEEVQRLQERATRTTLDLNLLRMQKTQTSQKVAQLDVEVSELRMKAESAKFNEERSVQTLQSVREENKALMKASTDLDARFSTYRVQMQSELSQLQVETETVQNRMTALETTHVALQRTYNEQTRRLTDAHANISTLTTALASQKATYRLEIDRLVEEVRVLEKRVIDSRRTVEDRERELEKASERLGEKEQVWESRIRREEQSREESEKRAKELGAVVEKLALATGEGGEISPAAAIAGIQRATGKSYTQVFADNTVLEHRLREREDEIEGLRRILEEIDNDIRDKKPLLDDQAAEHARAVERANALAAELGTAATARDAAQNRARSLEAAAAHHADEVAALQTATVDLSRQVQALLRQVAIQEHPELVNVPIGSDIAVADTGDIITDRLLEFKSLRGLQEQNQKLIRVNRSLLAQLSAQEEQQIANEEADVAIGERLDHAGESLTRLHRELLSAQAKVTEVTRERDSFSKMLAQGQGLKWTSAANGRPTDADGSDAAALEMLQDELSAVRQRAATEVEEARQLAAAKTEAVGVAEVARARAEAKTAVLEEQCRLSNETNALQKQEQAAIESQLRHLQAQIAQAQAGQRSAMEQVVMHQASETKLRDEAAMLRAERDQWQGTQNRLQADFAAVQQERARLQHTIDKLGAVGEEAERTHNEETARMGKKLEDAQRESASLRSQLEQAREATRAAERRLADFDSRLSQETAAISAARNAAEALAEARQSEISTLSEELTKAKGEAEKSKNIGINWQRRARELQATIETEKTARDSAAKDTESEAAQLRTEIGELKGKVEEANRKLDEAKRANELKDGTISRLQAELAKAPTAPGASAKADPSTATLQAERDALQQKLAQLEGKLAAARAAQPAASSTPTDSASAEGLQAKYDEALKSLAEKDQRYENDVMRVNRSNQGLQNRLRALQSDNEALRLRITELEATVAELNAKADGPAATVPSEDAADINKRVSAAVDAAKAEWQQAKEQLESKLADAEARASLPAIGANTAAAPETVASDAAQAQLAAAKKTIEELETKAKALNRQLKTAEITRKTLEKKLETVERQSGTPGPSSAVPTTAAATSVPQPSPATAAPPVDVKPSPSTLGTATASKTAVAAPNPAAPGTPPTMPAPGPAATTTESVRGAARGRGRAVRGRGTGRPNSVLATVNATLGSDEAASGVKRPAPDDGEANRGFGSADAAGSAGIESKEAVPAAAAAAASATGTPERGRAVKRMRGAGRGRGGTARRPSGEDHAGGAA